MNKWHTNRGTILSALLVLGLTCVATPAETLTYTLRPEPDKGSLTVELTWETSGRESSRLCVPPRWGTVDDVPALIRDLEINGASAVRDRACWDLEHRRGASITCRYTIRSNQRELTWDGVHYPIVTRTFFHGVGSAFLLSPAPGGGMPDEYDVLLRWQVPRDWEAVCSWSPGRNIGARLSADDLRRSTYLAGRLAVQTQPIEGAGELTVAMPEDFAFSAQEFANVAAGIITAEIKAMDERSFPPFVITVVPVGERLEGGEQRLVGSGLYRSFVLWLSPGAQLSEGVEHLFAHELFHYWNGGLLRAEDPQGPVLWFVEGFTDYYALRILYDSGRWTPGVYAKWINRHMREYEQNPARNARNDEIARDYWAQRNTVGEVPYQRGLLLGLRWNALAHSHGVPDGVDRFFKELLRRGRNGDFRASNPTLLAAGKQTLGDWFAGEFEKYVERAETVDVPTDALAPKLTGRVKPTYEYELGFDRERSLKQQRVIGLIDGSAAAKAGLREGDELLGWDIQGDVNKKIQLQVLRDKKVKAIRYFPRGKKSFTLQFTPAGA